MLARFFAWLDRALRPAPLVAAAPAPLPEPFRPDEPPRLAAAEPARGGAPMALLSVDGGGQYLLVCAERVTLGHLRAARADLPVLADVGALQAEFVAEDSLREGPGWRVVPLGGEALVLDGKALAAEGGRLRSGARLRCGANLELVFRVPDPASASALVEFQHGVECLGARRVLLVADGPGGRFALGAGAKHAVRVPGLELVLGLERVGNELVLVPEPGTVTGEPCVPHRVPLPPRERLCLSFGAARGSRPPFQCFLEPVAHPGRAR